MSEQAKANLSEICKYAIDTFAFCRADNCLEFLVIGKINNDLSTGLVANGIEATGGTWGVVVMEISEREFLCVKGQINQAELIDYFNPFSYTSKKNSGLTAKEFAAAGTAQILATKFDGQDIEVGGQHLTMHISVPEGFPTMDTKTPPVGNTHQAYLSDICAFAIDNYAFCRADTVNEFLVEGDIYCDMATGLTANHIPAEGGTHNVVVMERSETEYLCVHAMVNGAGLIDYFNPLAGKKGKKGKGKGKKKKGGYTATDIASEGTAFILETFKPQEIEVGGHMLTMHINLN